MALTPDPYDRLTETISQAIARGFEDVKAQQAMTGFSFDPKSLQAFRQVMAEAVQEGTSKTAVSGGRGGVPKIFNPAAPSTSLPSPSGQAPKVMPHSYKWEGGTSGVVQAASTFLSHRIAQRTQTALHGFMGSAQDQTKANLQAKLDSRGRGWQVGDYDSQSGKWNILSASGDSVGQMAATTSAVTPDVGAMGKLMTRGSIAAGALAGIGSGQGMFAGAAEGAMMAGAPELAIAIPAIKAMADAAKEMVDMPEKLRAAGAQYQGIYGGSALGGLGQQALQGGFSLSQMFDLGFGQAGEAFQGVSQLGIQGGTRQNMLNFIVSQYNKAGVSVKQGLELVQQAASQGNTELVGLANSIDAVTQSAKSAGVNASTSRESYMGALSGLFQSGVAQNPTSQGIAQGLTSYAAGGGQLFQGQNIPQLFTSTQSMMAMGGISGVGVETIQGLATSPGGTAKYMQILGSAFNEIAGPFIQMVMPLVQQYVAQWKKNGVKASQITGDSSLITVIVSQMQQSDQTQSWTQGCVSAVAQVTGQTVAPDIACAMVVLQAIQQAWPQTGVGIGAQAQNAPTSGSLNKTAMSNLSQIQSLTNKPQFSQVGTKVIASTNNSQVSQILQSAGVSVSHGIVGGESKYQQAYLNYVMKNNQQNPLLAKIASDKNLAKQKFTVQGPNGQSIDVDYQTLISKYLDQVNAGSVTFASGSYAGAPLTQVTGVAAGKGTAPSAKAAKGSTTVNGTITIAPTQALSNLLTFSSPDFNIATANNSNLPVTPYSTPTANPATSGSSG